MTAVVGILNKQAIAIAADSAVTIGGNGGRKIFNKANKVFTLSKQHPVGVLIYNSATLMTTPWETIIKVYRKHLGDKSFPTVKQYQEDFIDFIRSKQFYSNAQMQLVFLENFALNIINSIIDNTAQENPLLVDTPNPENQRAFIAAFEANIDSLILSWSANTNYCPEFADYTFEAFDQYSGITFAKIVQERFVRNGFEISAALLLKLKNAVFAVLRVKEEISNFTGLIFTGFGEDEIYPQLIPVNFSMVTNDRLRYYVNEGSIASITDDNPSAVCPFAQTDVIETILTGIDPSLDSIYRNNFDLLLKKYNQTILDSIGDDNPLLSE